MEELKQPMYAEAWRIFMNPYATERQLIRASKDLVGHGVSRELDTRTQVRLNDR